jgi:hypothetical protein
MINDAVNRVDVDIVQLKLKRKGRVGTCYQQSQV